ncbi:hypothetical protein RUM44_000023 [Polyplax serrata]|uniref:Uncharacterized protein n=1 Tax=Polyplax serrata TaxID=468196 RepID=A0ABR1B495_POLSC
MSNVRIPTVQLPVSSTVPAEATPEATATVPVVAPVKKTQVQPLTLVPAQRDATLLAPPTSFVRRRHSWICR